MRARRVGRPVSCLLPSRNPLRFRQTALPRERQIRSWSVPPNLGCQRILTWQRTPRARPPARLVRPSSECSRPGDRWHGSKIPPDAQINRAAGIRRHASGALADLAARDGRPPVRPGRRTRAPVPWTPSRPDHASRREGRSPPAWSPAVQQLRHPAHSRCSHLITISSTSAPAATSTSARTVRYPSRWPSNT